MFFLQVSQACFMSLGLWVPKTTHTSVKPCLPVSIKPWHRSRLQRNLLFDYWQSYNAQHKVMLLVFYTSGQDRHISGFMTSWLFIWFFRGRFVATSQLLKPCRAWVLKGIEILEELSIDALCLILFVNVVVKLLYHPSRGQTAPPLYSPFHLLLSTVLIINLALSFFLPLWWPPSSLPIQTVSVFSTHRCDNPALSHSTTSQPHSLTSTLLGDLTLSHKVEAPPRPRPSSGSLQCFHVMNPQHFV